MADIPDSAKTIRIALEDVTPVIAAAKQIAFERVEATRAAPPAMDREAVETDGYVLVPAVATRAMVDAADACTDAYSAYAAMVEVARVR